MIKKVSILSFVVLVGILAFVLWQFGIPFSQFNLNKPADFKLPVSFESKIISNAFVTYRFVSTIKTLKTKPDVMTLTLAAPDAELPAFSLKSAKIFKIVNGGSVPASISELGVNLRVMVQAFYDVRNSTWTTVSVSILPPLSSQPLE